MKNDLTPPAGSADQKPKVRSVRVTKRARAAMMAGLSCCFALAMSGAALLAPTEKSVSGSFRSAAPASVQGRHRRDVALWPVPSLARIASRLTEPGHFLPDPNGIVLLASDCLTPKNTFDLGETVCVQVFDVDPNLNAHIDWVGASGLVLARGPDIPAGSQIATFTIPANGNVGTWRVNITSPFDGAPRASGVFTVRNPNNVAVDLSVGDFAGQTLATAGSNAIFEVTVSNLGPDTAANVQLTDAVPANTTFVSATQTSGAGFTCNHPAMGETGTSTCSIASLANGDAATFEFVYQVNSGTANETLISNTATVSSSTNELQPQNNTDSDNSEVFEQPCVVTCPANITMPNDQDRYGAVVNYPSVGTSGASCGTLSHSQASGTFFPVGTTVVSVGGESGNPCSFTVTISDSQAPTISCPTDITTLESPAGAGSAIVNYSSPVANDNDPAGANVSCDHPSGSSFNVGTTSVTCSATDAAGNSNACSFNVTVQSTAACTITAPANITRNVDPGSCGAVVTYEPPVTSNCTGATVTQISGLPSGGNFPVGTTTNTFKVTDQSNSSSTSSFTVTVIDNEKPSITCPAGIIASAAANSCEAMVNVIAPNATDNCSGVTVTGVRDDGAPLNAPYPVGPTSITWRAKDAAGNTAECQQIITVRDQTPPTVIVPASVPAAIADANCLAPIPDISPNVLASDNCTPGNTLTITQSPAANTLVGAGNHTITITVEDSSGNKTIKTTSFTVIDNTPPIIVLNGQTISLWPPNHKYTTVAVNDLVSSAGDSCDPSINLSSVVIQKVSSDEGAAADNDIIIAPDCKSVQLRAERLGSGNGRVYTITFKVTDASGNFVTAIGKVTVPHDQGNGNTAIDDGPAYTVFSSCP